MTIRRGGLIVLVLLAVIALAGWLGWQLALARLTALGIHDLEVKGTDLSTDRLAFRSLAFNYRNDGQDIQVHLEQPEVKLDWSDLQVEAVTVKGARLQGKARGGTEPQPGKEPPESSVSSRPADLALPEQWPFWVPRQLAIDEFSADLPCRAGECRFGGQLGLVRQADSVALSIELSMSPGWANAVDVTSGGDRQPLRVSGNLKVATGIALTGATRGELTVNGLKPWLSQWLEGVPPRLLPFSARLELSPTGSASTTLEHWPVQVKLTTKGGADLALTGRWTFESSDPWQLHVDNGRLTGQLAEWRQSGWVLRRMAADLKLAGTLAADSVALRLLSGSSLRIRHIDPVGQDRMIWVDNLTLDPSGLAISSDLSVNAVAPQISGPVSMDVDQLRYPGLRPQPWSLDGEVAGRFPALTYTGTLGSQSGTAVTAEATWHPDQRLTATAGFTLTSDNRANHLAETLTAWPPSLTMSSGQIDVGADLQWQAGEAPESSARLVAAGASGVYNRMAWEGLTGEVRVMVDGERLQVVSDPLRLDQLNPGLPLGPIRVQAQYQAPLQQVATGKLILDRATAGFAGGILRVAPERWSLAAPPWKVPVIVEDVDLAELLALYPTEGLSGKGTLAGTLPVVINRDGFRVEGGHIHALEPGGTLQLPAQKLRSLGQANAAMELVARAMEDFHYRVLESTIDYAGDGTLLLALHLEGSSPNVDSERPIELNINLEEDIPALLTSLQLSGRVNEAVTKRVRELMERKQQQQTQEQQ